MSSSAASRRITALSSCIWAAEERAAETLTNADKMMIESIRIVVMVVQPSLGNLQLRSGLCVEPTTRIFMAPVVQLMIGGLTYDYIVSRYNRFLGILPPNTRNTNWTSCISKQYVMGIGEPSSGDPPGERNGIASHDRCRPDGTSGNIRDHGGKSRAAGAAAMGRNLPPGAPAGEFQILSKC